MRLLITFLAIMFCIMLSVYHMVTDNPLQRNYNVAMNTDLSWHVPACNVFNGKKSVILGSSRPCIDFSHTEKKTMKLYISIHSTPREANSRNNLRKLFKETVGVAKSLGVEMLIRHQFVIGRTNKEYLLAIEKEFLTHDDVVIGDFVDSYRNLTLKMMFGLLYANQFCQTADFVLKMDDDMFYNPIKLISLLQSSPRKRVYIGMSNANRFPRRNPNNKFYISPVIYKDGLFPPFVFGGATILSMDSIKHLNKSHYKVPCLPLEDTYMGLLMNGYAEVTWTSMWSRTEGMNRPLTDCELSSTVFVESRKYQEFYVENKVRLQPTTNCHLLTNLLQYIF